MLNSKNEINPDTTMFFQTSLVNCPCCDTPLQIFYHTNVKTIRNFEKIIRAKHIVKFCPNNECLLRKGNSRGKIESGEFQLLALPNCQYGLEITLFIGYYITQKNYSQNEVHKELLLKNIKMSESSVFRQYQKYLSFLQDLSEDNISDLKEEIISNKGYILSVDAVQNNNSPSIFVGRDLITGKVLEAKIIESENEVDITAILLSIKENYGNPIAIVSDMNTGIKKSIEHVFPNIKHQYCQYHFLKNLGKDLLGDQYDEISQIVRGTKKNYKISK